MDHACAVRPLLVCHLRSGRQVRNMRVASFACGNAMRVASFARGNAMRVASFAGGNAMRVASFVCVSPSHFGSAARPLFSRSSTFSSSSHHSLLPHPASCGSTIEYASFMLQTSLMPDLPRSRCTSFELHAVSAHADA
eukprot:2331124-Pleurochrysis_carterae.AAC.1